MKLHQKTFNQISYSSRSRTRIQRSLFCINDGHPLGPSTSRSSHPDPPQSSSTPVKPSMNNTGENEIGDSETDHTGVKENSLNSPNTAKNVTDSKNSDEESDRSSPEVEQREECEEYEIVDTSNGEYACEQPGAQIVLSESDSREELVIPSVNEEPGAFWHATVSPGKRHLIQVMVGTPRASLSWKFSTEKKVKTCVAHWSFLGLVSCRIELWDYFGDVAFCYWLSRRCKGHWVQIRPPKQSHNAIRNNTDPVFFV